MTTIEKKQIEANVVYKEILGRSSEEKPVNSEGESATNSWLLADHSLFIETDTGETYDFNSETNTWSIFGGN